MLRAIRRPSATARGSIENWSRSSTMSAIPLLIWLPEPIATASRARFSAGTSLTPSPIIATKRPPSASAPTSACFCSGVIRQKTVLRSAASPRPALSSGSSDPSITAGLPRHADRLGDGGHGLAGVAGDQLQVDLLGAHELDRLGGVGAQGLLEHDQRGRLERRWGLRGRVGGQRRAGAGEGHHPAARRGVLGERVLERPGQGQGDRRRSARREPRARSWPRSGSTRSTSRPRRTGPRR